MRARVDGFSPAVFDWFTGLERDNSRAYFAATLEFFEAEIRGGLLELLEKLSEEFGGNVRLFRQHRDLRYTKDRSPYKIRTYGILERVPRVGADLYADVSSRGLYAGTGYMHLAPDQLQRYRDAVADEIGGDALERATAGALNAGLKLTGATLRTTPRGFSSSHPRIELLRRKGLVAGRVRSGAAWIPATDAFDHVAETWRAAAAIGAWFDQHVGPSATWA